MLFDTVQTEYRIHIIWAPLLNRTPPNEYSNTTPIKNQFLPQKLAKTKKLQPNLNWTQPKNPFLKVEPWDSINADKYGILAC